MAKEIWLGPLLGSNRARLIERCAALVSEGQSDSFLYLAASHPLLEVISEEILDGSCNRGVWGEFPVYLFRGLVGRILLTAVNETGGRLPPSILIDREELPLQRSLISQILARLKAQGELKAIGPLAHSDGCVNTIVKLMGELERAAKSPAELRAIVEERSSDANSPTSASVPLQVDFDREVALIYEAYQRALSQNTLTEDNADQLRALAILRGKLEGNRASVPWLFRVKFLVLDGFFDFTPVQGEMLRLLIPSVPEVVVNLNHDERNPEIFRAFHDTIGQLQGMDTFDVKRFNEPAPVSGALTELKEKLFNPSVAAGQQIDTAAPTSALDNQNSILTTQAEIQLFECTDRETEIRAVAKEIKRLVFSESYQLSDIALIVRELESYGETIERVMREESIPCNLERRMETVEIPAVRAARKLFQLLTELAEDVTPSIRISILADLIKSEYFRLADDELATLADDFAQSYAALLRLENNGSFAPVDREREEWLSREAGIGRWDVDGLENVIAYVGANLPVTKWLARAGQLLAQWPQVNATRKLVAPDPTSDQKDDDPEDNIVDADKIELDTKAGDLEKKRRPARDVHPTALAWASLVIRRLSDLIKNVPRAGQPPELRLGILRLLEQLQFYRQIRKPLRATADSDLPQAMLDLRGLEALRRSLVATIKSFEIAQAALPAKTGATAVALSSFLNEVSRCLSTQAQAGTGVQHGGLRVHSATDVRGLRFRALFIAGLIEGGFPLRASRDWIYPHEERARLKEFGLTLEDISPATLLKEEHYFYQAACRATERLYLLRPLSPEDGTETVASYYIEELRRAIEPAALEASIMRRDFDGKEVLSASTPSEFARSLVRQQEQRKHSVLRDALLPADHVDRLIAWAHEKQYLSASALVRIDIERERSSGAFGPHDGLITDEHLRAMLGNQFGASAVHSASGLSIYGNCPYQFFARRVLKLEPRGEAALDLQALDAGKLLHDVLRRFFERHRGERLSRSDLPELRRELAEMADRVFNEHQRVVPPLNPHIWKIDREIRKILLDQVLLFEMGVQGKGKKDVRPAYFEVAFGMKPHQPADTISKTEHLELSRSGPAGEEKIKIQGQIDRVDVCEGPEGHTLIAYDYKLSNGYNSPDMVAGRTLQVPIYLEALERLILPNYQIAGGGYYTIRGGTNRRNKGLYRAGYSDYTGIQAKSSVWDDNDWQRIRSDAIKKIWQFLDGMRCGSFVVSPSEGKKTCRFCDFAAVCRYERYRIDRKNRNE
ncbi:MAG: PD-(D/E)XK nuclease family protein [Pyrinomonadaceae bacterium]|nr:PD-(D/E)XK nuclease family protein [Pyrinomonadaceae bacterium]